MRRGAKIGAGLLALVLAPPAALWTIGSTLPPTHVACVEAHLSAAPPAVWARIADPVSSARWRPSVREVVRLPDRDGQRCFREDTSFGPLVYVHEAREDGERLVSRIVDNDDFGGTWEYALAPDGEGTRLVITEHGEVHSPLFRVLGKYVFGFDTTLRTYVADLEAELAAGA